MRGLHKSRLTPVFRASSRDGGESRLTQLYQRFSPTPNLRLDIETSRLHTPIPMADATEKVPVPNPSFVGNPNEVEFIGQASGMTGINVNSNLAEFDGWDDGSLRTNAYHQGDVHRPKAGSEVDGKRQ